MTRKDYIRIAKIVKDNKLYTNNSTRKILKHDSLVNDFVIMLKKDNNNFDKQRFIDACQQIVHPKPPLPTNKKSPRYQRAFSFILNIYNFNYNYKFNLITTPQGEYN